MWAVFLKMHRQVRLSTTHQRLYSILTHTNYRRAKNIHEETFNRAFIDAVIDLCHSVGIEVTVEGVEESTELDAVRTIGADSIQGFFISRPIPARIFEERFLTPQTTF